MRQPAEASVAVSERRVAALVLPALLCELAESANIEARSIPEAVGSSDRPSNHRVRPRPFGVVLEDSASHPELRATDVLSAVNDVARRLGVREGQTLAEARAISAGLVITRFPRKHLEAGLERIAEVALAFGATVAFSAPDTVWVDVTGSSHLFGGEAELMLELVDRVREIGHRVRGALASGPRLAQAFARFGEVGKEGYRVVPITKSASSLLSLPVRALGLPSELESWLLRLGVLCLSDLVALPKSALAGRLGEHAHSVFELIAGCDMTPLVAYVPPRRLVEETSFDEPTFGSQPLLFVLRGLSARLGARLSGRGEAAHALVLDVCADAAIARFRKAPLYRRLEFALPKPLWKTEEIYRVVASRLERLELDAPSVGLKMEVTELSEAVPRQLELGPWVSGTSAEALDELPIVLAELVADLGEDRVGVLKPFDSHRPELASELVSALSKPSDKPRLKKARASRAERRLLPEGTSGLAHRMTRLLPKAVAFETSLRVGAAVAIGRRFYGIENLAFEQRLEAVEWWSQAVFRDYVRVVLRGSDGVLEGLVYVDRDSGKRYLQGIWD